MEKEKECAAQGPDLNIYSNLWSALVPIGPSVCPAPAATAIVKLLPYKYLYKHCKFCISALSNLPSLF